MSKSVRPIVEVSIGHPPAVFAPQGVIVKGFKSDGSLFQVDIGRVCYLDRKKDLDMPSKGKNHTKGRVNIDSLSSERVNWVRNYLSCILRTGWREETLRGELYNLRYFFQFCDFDGGSKPETLAGVVGEYQRYHALLDQRGRMSGKPSLSGSTIYKQLKSTRRFIQWAFDLSNEEILALIPKSRTFKSNVEEEWNASNLNKGQDYLRACISCFNQFADAILDNQYPIRVKPPNSSDENLYWHGTRATTLKSLPGCFDKNGDPLPYDDIRHVLIKNFNSQCERRFYDNTLVRNRRRWKNGVLTSQKRYAYNVSTFCFFCVYLGFTGANVQPTLDLRISNIDLSKIGSGAFAKKHKFRAGRTISFTAPSHLKREVLKYLKIREWAEKQGISGDVEDFLFIKIGENNYLKRLERNSGIGLVRESPLFKGVEQITSSELRRLSGEYFIRKSQGKISLVAKKLNNSISVAAKAYMATEKESQAIEMNRFHSELGLKVRSFERISADPISIRLAESQTSERVAIGSCSNLEGDVPLRSKGFNSEAPEPACGTFESCLFCSYFSIHIDVEDVHKLLSLREALHLASVIRNDPEHYMAVIEPALFRIEEILTFISGKNNSAVGIISEVEKYIEMGVYSVHWSRQIQALTARSKNFGEEL